MALTFNRLDDGKEQDMPQFRAPHNIYVNADRTKVVPHHSPDAAFLFLAKGHTIPESEARRLGLIDPPKPATLPEEIVTVDEKALSPVEDKAVKPSQTKGR